MGAMSANADRPRAKSLNPLRSLLPFLLPYRGMMIAALAALLVASVAMLSLPLAIRQLIDHVIAAKDAAILTRFLIGFLAASVIFGVTSGCGPALRGLPAGGAHGPLVLRNHPGR
jgi:ATP-binding cassette subfamily B protein